MKINTFNNSKNISGRILYQLKMKNNLTQQQLAEKLQLLGVGLTIKEISKIEHNQRLVLDFELFALAKVFNVPAETFNECI